MTPRSADHLLRLPVRLNGVTLGRTVEVLLDRDALKAVGLDVLCGDGKHRLLPLSTARVTPSAIAVDSPFHLLEQDELTFYRSRTHRLSALLGGGVARRGEQVGLLRELLLDRELVVRAIVVESDGVRQRLPYEGSLQIGLASRPAA